MNAVLPAPGARRLACMADRLGVKPPDLDEAAARDALIEMRWAGRWNGPAMTRSQVSSATGARAGPRTPASTPSEDYAS